MIEIAVTKDMLVLAKAQEIKETLKNSHTDGEGNFAGSLGQVLVQHNHPTLRFHETFNFDLVTLIGDTVEVKSKRCTSVPKPHYNATVYDTNDSQEADYYYFTRIMDDLSVGFLMGFIRRHDFFKRASYFKAGEKDYDGHVWEKSGVWQLRYKFLTEPQREN